MTEGNERNAENPFCLNEDLSMVTESEMSQELQKVEALKREKFHMVPPEISSIY